MVSEERLTLWVACVATLVALAAAVAFAVVRFGGPTCDELGGKRVFSHHVVHYQPGTKTTILIPQYKCVTDG